MDSREQQIKAVMRKHYGHIYQQQRVTRASLEQGVIDRKRRHSKLPPMPDPRLMKHRMKVSVLVDELSLFDPKHKFSVRSPRKKVEEALTALIDAHLDKKFGRPEASSAGADADLQPEVDRLNGRVEELLAKCEHAGRTMDLVIDEKDAIQNHAASLERDVADLETKVAALEVQNEELLEVASAPGEASGDEIDIDALSELLHEASTKKGLVSAAGSRDVELTSDDTKSAIIDKLIASLRG